MNYFFASQDYHVTATPHVRHPQPQAHHQYIAATPSGVNQQHVVLAAHHQQAATHHPQAAQVGPQEVMQPNQPQQTQPHYIRPVYRTQSCKAFEEIFLLSSACFICISCIIVLLYPTKVETASSVYLSL